MNISILVTELATIKWWQFFWFKRSSISKFCYRFSKITINTIFPSVKNLVLFFHIDHEKDTNQKNLTHPSWQPMHFARFWWQKVTPVQCLLDSRTKLVRNMDIIWPRRSDQENLHEHAQATKLKKSTSRI